MVLPGRSNDCAVPDAVQIATTYSDPSYETAEYQEFLTALGYSPHPTAKAAWSKEIQRAA